MKPCKSSAKEVLVEMLSTSERFDVQCSARQTGYRARGAMRGKSKQKIVEKDLIELENIMLKFSKLSIDARNEKSHL